ncbi:MAG: hypothetical protein R3B99_16875 [Polyangiales bacterium]
MLEALQERHGGYELLAHWKQGEFHHDVLASDARNLPAPVLVVATV